MDRSVYFSGHYDFRTLNGSMSSIVPLLTSVIYASVSMSVLRTGNDLLAIVVGVGFGFGAFVFGSFGLVALWNWILKRRIYVEINDKGIVSGIQRAGSIETKASHTRSRSYSLPAPRRARPV